MDRGFRHEFGNIKSVPCLSHLDNMSMLGIMTYGFDKALAENIQAMLSEMLGADMALICASNREAVRVGQILEDGPNGSVFGDAEPKIIMLLGFDDDQTKILLRNYPRKDRPIFCGLTMENIKWELSNLIEHLLEEKVYWDSQKK